MTAASAGGLPRPNASIARERLTLSSAGLLERVALVNGAGGELWLAATGWSMRPALPEGARALLTPLVSVPSVGDIVLTAGNPVVLHRVLRASRTTVQTAGDSSPRADEPVPLGLAAAVVTAIDTGQGPSLRGVRSPVGWRARLRFALRRIATSAGAPWSDRVDSASVGS
ncbi:MAG: S24/S26 family peptidase [Gemmatimonadota bacterium]|nr:S24/S26 family peptidase [Gemmatimonadota bacterium]